MHWIKKAWQKYINWCDQMGFTPEAKRCCMPNLQEPELEKNKLKQQKRA